MNYDVDIVLVIDTTGSMADIIDLVKDNAIHFCQDLHKKMNTYQKSINTLRVKAISFTDFHEDPLPLNASKFFNLPAENQELADFVETFEADGGGYHEEYPHNFDPTLACPPESGLEALAYSILQSEFTKSTKKRDVIVLWTDAYAHPLEYSHRATPSYPWMPKSFQAITSAWGQHMSNSAKRLILFTPDVYPWKEISENWENVIHCVSKTAGTTGVPTNDYEAILETIVNSI
jgi:hypothetical protein